MTRLWTDGEAVSMTLGTDGWPASFTWQGRAHAVQQVRQRWQVDGDWWSEAGRVWREYIALTTADGLLCVLYFDLAGQTWHLAAVYD